MALCTQTPVAQPLTACEHNGAFVDYQNFDCPRRIATDVHVLI